MNKKLAIVSGALIVSSQAMALIGPSTRVSYRACVNITKGSKNVQYAGNCDMTNQNSKTRVKLLENGCAKGQALFASYEIELPQCLDPRITQL